MRGTLFTLVAVILLALMSSSALADDVWGGPPEGQWVRGDPGSTWQHWNFSDPTSSEPDEGQNEYGDPVSLFDESMWTWVSGLDPLNPPGDPVDGFHFDGQEGSIGTMIFQVPNQPKLNEIKKIFVQVTSSKGPSGITALGFDSVGGGYTSGVFNTGRPLIQHINGWYTYNYGLTIEPNPEWEDIAIEFPFDTIVDQVVIDTICTPEPATLTMMAIGAVALVRRRRRK